MAATTPLPRAVDSFAALPQSSHIDALDAVTTAQSTTIPTGARFVLMSATGTFYAKIGGTGTTAAVVTGTVSDGTGSMCNPTFRVIPDGATLISVAAPASVDITFEYFIKPAF